MNEVATFTTTPYPMKGFEGDLDSSRFYSRFQQIGDELKEKRERDYVQGSTPLSFTPICANDMMTAAVPVHVTYYHSEPRDDTIKFFTFPHQSEHTPQPSSPEPTKDRMNMYMGAFYGVFVSFSLAALRTRFIGEPTRAIDLSTFAGGPKNKPSEGWIRQERGRINDVILQRRDAASTSGWDKWFQKVEEALHLEKGWNGDDAPAPELVSAVQSTRLLDAMRRADYPPTRIAASAMGGIAITRKVGNKKVLVEFYNDGRAYFLFSDRGSGSMDVKPLLPDQASLTRFIASMRDFLNG